MSRLADPVVPSVKVKVRLGWGPVIHSEPLEVYRVLDECFLRRSVATSAPQRLSPPQMLCSLFG